MTTLHPDLEALMPEPDGYLTDWPAIGGGMRKLYGPTRTAGDSLAFKVTPVYSEAKLHAAMQAVNERAAKLAAELAYDAAIKYANGREVDFEKEVAAAIRGTA
jgi:hypothetical protein